MYCFGGNFGFVEMKKEEEECFSCNVILNGVG